MKSQVKGKGWLVGLYSNLQESRIGFLNKIIEFNRGVVGGGTPTTRGNRKLRGKVGWWGSVAIDKRTGLAFQMK